MEKIIEAALGLVEIAVIAGVIGYSGAMSFRALHDNVRIETIDALKRPTPSPDPNSALQKILEN